MAYHEAYQILVRELEQAEVGGQAIGSFLLRKLKLQAREVTPQELQIILKDSKVSNELQRKILNNLQMEEQLRYTGGSGAFTREDWLGLAKQIQGQL